MTIFFVLLSTLIIFNCSQLNGGYEWYGGYRGYEHEGYIGQRNIGSKNGWRNRGKNNGYKNNGNNNGNGNTGRNNENIIIGSNTGNYNSGNNNGNFNIGRNNGNSNIGSNNENGNVGNAHGPWYGDYGGYDYGHGGDGGNGHKGCLKEENIHYMDSDIDKKIVGGLDECANWCGETKECKVWTLQESDNLCCIKSSNSGRQSHVGYISGTKSCAIGCMKEDNIIYMDNDIDQKIVGGIDECANWCGDIKGCKFWTLQESDNLCCIKTSNSGRQRLVGYISGTKSCSPGCLKEENVLYMDNDIEKKIVGGLDECANWCGEIKGCKFWTLQESDNLCCIKSSNSGRQSQVGYISGTKSCAVGCMKEDNIMYMDNDIDQKIVGGIDECANWCGDIKGCNFWTLQESDNLCCIKTSNSGRQTLVGYISGTKSCSPGCLKEENILYVDNDIDKKIVGGLDECANWCGETKGCTFWTLQEFDNLCCIKSSNSGRQSHVGYISGTKSCAIGCMKEDNIIYMDNDIDQKIVGGIDECAKWCGDIKRCKFWTLQESDNLCCIKTSNAGRQRLVGYISGTKSCSPDVCRKCHKKCRNGRRRRKCKKCRRNKCKDGRKGK